MGRTSPEIELQWATMMVEYHSGEKDEVGKSEKLINLEEICLVYRWIEGQGWSRSRIFLNSNEEATAC